MRINGMDANFAPRSVAVIGASSDPRRIGGRPVDFLRRRGFAGPILPINPKSAEVQGLPAYPSLAEAPLVPDLAVIARLLRWPPRRSRNAPPVAWAGR